MNHVRRYPAAGIACLYVLIVVLPITLSGCAGQGLVTEQYTSGFYEVPGLSVNGSAGRTGHFLVYSDSQAGWRVREKFLKSSNWTDWKMLIVPFYQLYLLGNGLWGTVNWCRHIPDYGGKERRMVRDAIYAEAKQSRADFILNVGDMVADDGRRPAQWGMFLKENKTEHPLLREIPYLPVLGNHERGNDSTFGYPNFQAVFDCPRFYTVEFEHGLLIVVDSNLILDQYEFIDDDVQDALFAEWFVSTDETDQPAWLETQLSQCDKPFRIVVMHSPPISYGVHHGDWLKPCHGRNLTEKRRRLLDLFERNGVQLVLSGHDHLYQHSTLQSEDGGEMHFLVGGGGGAPLRDVTETGKIEEFQGQFRNEGLNVSLTQMAHEFHFFRVDIGPDELTVQVVQVTDDADAPAGLIDAITCKNPNGSGPR